MDVSFSLLSTKLAFYKTGVFSSLPHKKLSCLLKIAFANKDRKDKEILFPFSPQKEKKNHLFINVKANSFPCRR